MKSLWAVLVLLAIVQWPAPIAAGDRARHAPNLPIVPEAEAKAKAERPGRTCPFDSRISTSGRVASTNCGAENRVEDYGPCAPGLSYPGPDQLYVLETDFDSTYIASLTLRAPTADLGIFLLSTCDDGSSCFDASDYYFPGTTEYIHDLPIGSTFYFYVDSYYASGKLSCGAYEIDISALPVELIHFTVE